LAAKSGLTIKKAKEFLRGVTVIGHKNSAKKMYLSDDAVKKFIHNYHISLLEF
jgi:hypothetical protein